MNFHNDQWIMNKLQEHYDEALKHFNKDRIVGIFVQGSQNYDLEYENSDIDTKLIVIPSLEDIVKNRQPVSTTFIMENEEHIDFKDIRLYMNCFRKQNINFVEILFTKYKILNPDYEEFWNRLIENREEIARYDEASAIRSIVGVAKEKYFAMEHEYPSKIEIINRFGYDPKQLHHLIRLKYFLDAYVYGTLYEACLTTSYITLDCNDKLLKEIKFGKYCLNEAREKADEVINYINTLYNSLDLSKYDKKIWIDELFDNVQYNIIKKSLKKELK